MDGRSGEVVVGWKSTVPTVEQKETTERIRSLVLASIRATTVLCCTWREDAGGPDFLEVDLSNGRLLCVYWDTTYSCRRLTVDSVDVTPSETGLPLPVVNQFVDQVYERLQFDRAGVES